MEKLIVYASPYLGAISLLLTVGSWIAFLVLRTSITEGIRARIQSAYAEKLEALKVQLKAEADSEIERFKSQATVELEKLRSQLSIAAAERQVRFVKLHDKRADVITELYRLLVETHSAVESYVRDDLPFGIIHLAPVQEREKRADEALNSLANYFVPNRIFVPQKVSDQVQRILREYNTGYVVGLIGHGAPTDVEKRDHFKLANEKIANLSETALVDLGQEFRALLGDETES